METTPANAHRVRSPLNWRRQGNRPPDGDVMRELAADGSPGLRAQPRGGTYRGASFFVPSSPEAADVAHAALGKNLHGCAITVPGERLPDQLRFIPDFNLKLPVVNASGETDTMVCGQHFTLYTSTKSSIKTFEAAYAKVMESCLPCGAEAQAMPTEVDWDYLPSDRATLVAAMALDDFAANSDDPNAKLFATLYTLHLRAADMKFEDVTKFTPMADMVAAALDAWTVSDPYLWGDTLRARDLLSKAVSFEFSDAKYKPFWDVHPFQFLNGVYTDDLYESEVRTAAQAFVQDKDLKAKVHAAALELFARLATVPDECQIDSQSFVHSGVTFTVTCARRACGESGHSDSASGGSI